MKENTLPRLLHVSTSRSWRSGEQQVSYLLEEFKSQDWPYLLLCRSRSALRRYSKRHRIESVSFKSLGLGNFLLAGEIARLCKKRPFDLIHVHDSRAHAAALLARWMGIRLPIVVSRLTMAPAKSGWFSRRRFNHQANQAIVCVSEAVSNSLRPFLRNQDLLRVIQGGIDPSAFELEIPHGRLRREYFIPDDYALIGNVSALVPHKDVLTFLKAAKILLKQNPRSFFLVIGDGPQRPELEKSIEKMELKDHVRITGTRKDLPEVMLQLDVLVSSSLSEGPGITILNAYAAQIPVVATAVGSVPEMVEHNHSGLLSPVGDAEALAENVLKILRENVLRKHLVAGGKKKLEQYHRSITAQKMMDLYRELILQVRKKNEKT